MTKIVKFPKDKIEYSDRFLEKQIQKQLLTVLGFLTPNYQLKLPML